jgi:anti-anti-sigma regulatory factor
MADKTSTAFELPAIIDLDAIDAIRDQLADALEEGSVIVGAGAVERVSTNGILLMVSAAETARRNHFEFAVATPSAAMLAAIERLGLGAQFSGMMKQ